MIRAWLRKTGSYLVHAAVHRYSIILPLAFLLTLIGFFYTFQLPLESDLAELLPEDYVSVRTLERVREEVGGFQTLQVLVEGKDLKAMKRYADVLAHELEKSPLVKFVDYKRDVEFYRRHALLYMPLQDLKKLRDRIKERITEKKLEVNPFFADLEEADEEAEPERVKKLDFSDFEKKYEATDDRIYYLNPDHTILVLNVFPTGTNSDINFARRFFIEIRSIVKRTHPRSFHPSLFVEYGGNFKNKIDEYLVLIRDVRSSVAVGLILVFLIIVLYFRRFAAGFVIGVPLLMGLSWTFGLTYLFIGRLNTMTVFLFVVLFGLGIDFGIHMLARFREERMKRGTIEEALEASLRGTGRALLTAALTTGVAFFSLMLADFRAFYEFGFIAGAGILLSLVAMLLVAPGFICIGARLGLLRNRKRRVHPMLHYTGTFPLARTILILAALFSVFSVFVLPRIHLEYDFSKLRSNLPDSVAVKKKLSPIFKESNSPAIVLVDRPEDLRELEATINEKIKTDPTPTIDKIRTIYTMLPRHQEEKIKIIAEIRDLLTDRNVRSALTAEELKKVDRLLELTDVHPIGVEDLPESIKRLFRAKDGSLGRFAYLYPSVQLRDGRNAIAFADDVKNIRTPSGKIFHASNAAVVFSDMLQQMIKEGRRAFLLSLFAVVFLVFLDFRNVTSTMIVIMPLLLGVLWVMGIMGILGIRLNIFNMVVIPTIVGMGIDHGVHLYHRYREEGPGSIIRVLWFTGGAILASTITTMVGFSGLAVAHHPALRSIGRLALIGLSTTLISAIIVLPAFLQVLELGWRRVRQRMTVTTLLPKESTEQDSSL